MIPLEKSNEICSACYGQNPMYFPANKNNIKKFCKKCAQEKNFKGFLHVKWLRLYIKNSILQFTVKKIALQKMQASNNGYLAECKEMQRKYKNQEEQVLDVVDQCEKKLKNKIDFYQESMNQKLRNLRDEVKAASTKIDIDFSSLAGRTIQYLSAGKNLEINNPQITQVKENFASVLSDSFQLKFKPTNHLPFEKLIYVVNPQNSCIYAISLWSKSIVLLERFKNINFRQFGSWLVLPSGNIFVCEGERGEGETYEIDSKLRKFERHENSIQGKNRSLCQLKNWVYSFPNSQKFCIKSKKWNAFSKFPQKKPGAVSVIYSDYSFLIGELNTRGIIHYSPFRDLYSQSNDDLFEKRMKLLLTGRNGNYCLSGRQVLHFRGNWVKVGEIADNNWWSGCPGVQFGNCIYFIDKDLKLCAFNENNFTVNFVSLT